MINEEKIFTTIVGNNSNIKLLTDSLNSSTDSRSWIIEGQKGIGKASITKLITSQLLNINIKNSNPSKDDFIHPDIFILEKDFNKKNIPVEDIRKLKSFFSKTSFKDNGRFAIIDSINDLNNYGHNALLKIIEEPPENSFIFIINHMTTLMPSTIKSRCKVFRFQRIPSDIIAQLLLVKFKSKDEGLIKAYSLLSNGSVGDAFFLYENNALNMYKILCNLFIKANELNEADINNFINKNLNSKNKLDIIKINFELLSYLINKIIKIKVETENDFLFQEESITLNKLAKNLKFKSLFNIRMIINNKFDYINKLNTDLHSTLFSLLIEIYNEIIKVNNEN